MASPNALQVIGADGLTHDLFLNTYLDIPRPLGTVMAITKTITIDEKTALIASKIPNFSRWVRQQLLKHARTEKDVKHTVPAHMRHTKSLDDNILRCNPKHKNGMCLICWGEE